VSTPRPTGKRADGALEDGAARQLAALAALSVDDAEISRCSR
jgi:hypothetical protein